MSKSEHEPPDWVKSASYLIKDIGLTTFVVLFLLGIWSGHIKSPFSHGIANNTMLIQQNQGLILASNELSNALCQNLATTMIETMRCERAHKISIAQFYGTQAMETHQRKMQAIDAELSNSTRFDQ